MLVCFFLAMLHIHLSRAPDCIRLFLKLQEFLICILHSWTSQPQRAAGRDSGGSRRLTRRVVAVATRCSLHSRLILDSSPYLVGANSEVSWLKCVQ